MRKENTYISIEELLRWKNGQLDEAALHQLEQQASEDVLLQDALEGLKEMKQPTRLNAINDNLQQKLQAKLPVNSATVIKPLWQQSFMQYGVSAAAVVLIVWLSFFFFQQTKNLDNKIAQTYPTSVDSSITSAEQPPTDSVTIAQNDGVAEKVKEESANNVAVAPINTETQQPQTINTNENKESEKGKEMPVSVTKTPPPFGFEKNVIADNNVGYKDAAGGNVNNNTKTLEDLASNEETKTEAFAPPSTKTTTSTGFAKKSENMPATASKPAVSPSVASAPTSIYADETVKIEKENKVLAPKKGKSGGSKKEPRAAKMEDKATSGDNYNLAEADDSAIETPFLKGKNLYDAGRYSLALAEFSEIPANSEDRYDADYFTGLCYMAMSEPAKAIPFFEKVANNKNHSYHKSAKNKLKEAKKAANQK